MAKARKKGAADSKKGTSDSNDVDDPSQETQEPEEQGDDEVEDQPSDVPLKVDDGVDADATAAAIEAAVVAAASVAEVPKETVTAAAAAAAIVQDALLAPSDRDVILGEGSAGHKTNLLLQDMIRLHRLLWTLHNKPKPTTAEEIQPLVDRIVAIIKNGKSFELAGLKDVPKPFMKSTGRFFGKDAETGDWKVLTDREVNDIMIQVVLEEFKVDDLGIITDSPYSDLKDWLTKNPGTPVIEFLPEAKDAILLPVEQEADKMYETQQGNKTLFHLASQLVTSMSNTPDKRVEAALNIMRGLDETLESMGTGNAMSKLATTTMKARFLIRSLREDRSVAWHLMDSASAAEFTIIFVFEVYLEKEIHSTDKQYPFLRNDAEDAYDENDAMSKPSTVPIAEPSELDVLFGRGGMTNRYVLFATNFRMCDSYVCEVILHIFSYFSHPGNRRFRDIIALHRPDYIRAVKMDKPAVARKIVKAIRQGFPPGRFLKKSDDDGMYYDVGDRNAAEKTSQGLRERTNAEKRQRSALREALRIRKQDMVEDDNDEDGAEGEAKKPRAMPQAMMPTLNYMGTNVPVPLSLNMKDVSTMKTSVVRAKKPKVDKVENDELNCAGLPPEAVDDEGNILVTEHDILVRIRIVVNTICFFSVKTNLCSYLISAVVEV